MLYVLLIYRCLYLHHKSICIFDANTLLHTIFRLLRSRDVVFTINTSRKMCDLAISMGLCRWIRDIWTCAGSALCCGRPPVSQLTWCWCWGRRLRQHHTTEPPLLRVGVARTANILLQHRQEASNMGDMPQCVLHMPVAAIQDRRRGCVVPRELASLNNQRAPFRYIVGPGVGFLLPFVADLAGRSVWESERAALCGSLGLSRPRCV